VRQFDVVANPAQRSRRFAPYLIVLQSHYLIGLDTTVVAPLVEPGFLPPDFTFALPVEFEDRPFTLALLQLFSVPTKRLGRVIGVLSAHDLEIARAWERVFTGF
jgi:hypothetical protein